jgi:hypothetical protein
MSAPTTHSQRIADEMRDAKEDVKLFLRALEAIPEGHVVARAMISADLERARLRMQRLMDAPAKDRALVRWS